MAVAVAVRIKPPGTDRLAVFPSEFGVVIQSSDASLATLDGFGSIVGGSDQEVMYDTVAAPLVEKLLEGYSCSLMAYGQTGSGKTHTIFGPPGVLTEAALTEADGCGGAHTAPQEWGIFPRIALELLASGKGTLHASAVEVYQERAYDLLADRAQLSVGAQKIGAKVTSTSARAGKDPNAAVPHKSTCSCRECYLRKEGEAKARKEALSKPRSVLQPATSNQASRVGSMGGKAGGSAKGASEESFATVGEKHLLLSEPVDVARLARTIEQTRTAVGHKLNARSSRSHCLVHLHLTERANGVVTKRQLLVVDLAGSERILRSGAEGVAAQQAMAINTSLSALGKVVRALGAKAAHVPYRDSTLTQLLRSSLAGKACTSMVVTVASDACYTDESKCSLEFGQRMLAVKTKAALVVGTTAPDERRETVRALDAARRELNDFEARGYGEKFGPAAQPGEVKQFKENSKRLAEYEAESSRCKTELAELGASGEAASCRGEMRELTITLREMGAEISNLQDLLARQKLISGFYIPARAVYTKKAAEVRAFENRLEVLEHVEKEGARGQPRVDVRVARQQQQQQQPILAYGDDVHSLPPPLEPEPATGPWQSYVNEANGHMYFHNLQTGESTYTPPPGFEMIDLQ